VEQGTGDHLGFWLIKVLSTTVGETGADSLAVHVGLGAALTTGVAGVLLAAWFGVWFRAEGTLSINAIDTRSRELFYWGAILVTFALGTAAGDLATEALGLGFRLGVLAFGALIAVIAVAWRAGMNAVLAFWLAYILTRPLGASLGDLLAQSREYGGLGLGTVVTSALFLAVIAALVIVISPPRRRVAS
jgi:uncharacterized membrane-anchored protein